MPLYLTHLALINIFATIIRPFSDLIYIIFAIFVGVALVFGLSSRWYRNAFNSAFEKIGDLIYK